MLRKIVERTLVALACPPVWLGDHCIPSRGNVFLGLDW
jgi:hypothetical protein